VRLSTIAGVTALLALWALAAGCDPRAKAAPARPKTPLVVAVRPLRRNLTRWLTLTGDVMGIQQAELTAKVPGFIKEVNVNRGDFVRRGQLLALLTYPEQEAAYAQARTNYELARVTYQRIKQLYDSGAESRQDLDNARASYRTAREALRTQKTLYDYRQIRAPFDGYIIQRNFDPGYLVLPGGANNTALFVIADISTVRVFVYVPEEDVGLLRVGARVTVTNDAYPGHPFAGKVTRLAQGLDPATRTMQTEIDIANREGELRPGMFARVRLALYERPAALTVPAEAVLRNSEGAFVYCVQDRRAKLVAIATGLQEDDVVEVRRGLDDRSLVVVSGWQMLTDNTPVRVALEAGNAGAQPALSPR
jgi:RND family efflux transporter MFP subunit